MQPFHYLFYKNIGGGSWYSFAGNCRSTGFNISDPDWNTSRNGFRITLKVKKEEHKINEK